MARNLKMDYLKKLMGTTTPNGYEFDLANYVHNPSYDHEYPSFRKTLFEDDEALTVREVFYLKHYNGTGEYVAKTMDYKKSEACGGWNVAKNVRTEYLGEGNRFSLKTLVSYC